MLHGTYTPGNTYVKTRIPLRSYHVIPSTLTVLITPAHLIPRILWFLACLDEVVVWDVGLGW